MEGQTPGPDAPKTLEEAQSQTESKWSLTMDEMETSRNTHGFYFARFGSDIIGKAPSRALVIKDRVQTTQGEGWVFITRDGPKFISTHNPLISRNISETINHRIQEEIQLVSNGQPFSENENVQPQGWTERSLLLGSSLNGSSAQHFGPPLANIGDLESLKFVQIAIDKSRENAEIPKKRIEDQIAAEHAKAGLAEDLTSFIKDLPPKT